MKEEPGMRMLMIWNNDVVKSGQAHSYSSLEPVHSVILEQPLCLQSDWVRADET